MLNGKAILLVLIAVFMMGVIGCNSANKESEEIDAPKGLEGGKINEEEVDRIEEKYGKLVWSDEFDYEGLPDPKKWSYDIGGHGWGNEELQYYTSHDPDNAYVKDGKLIITARKEKEGENEYTSARLVTREKGDWMYGRIEVRAKLPNGLGTWPAIWMRPTNNYYGNWPDSGEIDIMEHVAFDPGVIHGTIHTGKYNHRLGTQKGGSIKIDTYDTEFHVYALEWRPYQLKFFVDDQEFFHVEYDAEKEGEDGYLAWPFDQPFYLTLNVAVGGSWGGAQGVDENAFPQSMEVDYVRVYDLGYSVENSDKLPPGKPEIIGLSKVEEGYELRWKAPADDYGVRVYKVLMDGNVVKYSFVNRCIIPDIKKGETHQFQVVAVDHAIQSSISDKKILKVEK